MKTTWMEGREAADDESFTFGSNQVGSTVQNNEVKVGQRVGLGDGPHSSSEEYNLNSLDMQQKRNVMGNVGEIADQNCA